MPRLEGKIAIVIGAGQGPGTGMGNGRATALRFAQAGRESVRGRPRSRLRRGNRGDDRECRRRRRRLFAADVTKEATLAAAIKAAHDRWGRIDILHNNVGVSIAGGDAPPTEITEEAFDRIVAINLRGTVMACKHVLPIMRRATRRRDRQYLLDGGDARLSARHLQGDQGRA